jgi:two-component system OmpR family response regulator
MRIMVVEDDPDLSAFIVSGLQRQDHDVVAVSTGEQAMAMADGSSFDAIILDRMLPGESGLMVLKRWRSQGNRTPVLMLTALDGIDDRVEGLDAGADDHVGKPFALSELLARLNAIARRNVSAEAQSILREGNVTLNLLRREVRCGDKPVFLQPREIRLLEELMRNSGEAVTRQMLLEKVWGFSFDPQTTLVETHVSRLRSKLADGGAPDIIETVRGVGYRLKADA